MKKFIIQILKHKKLHSYDSKHSKAFIVYAVFQSSSIVYLRPHSRICKNSASNQNPLANFTNYPSKCWNQCLIHLNFSIFQAITKKFSQSTMKVTCPSNFVALVSKCVQLYSGFRFSFKESCIVRNGFGLNSEFP